MFGAVEPLPGAGVGEPEVGAAVDDQDIGTQLLGQRGGVTVRQAQEDDVVTGQHLGFGRFQHAVGERQQMRVVFGQRRSCTGRGGQRADRQPAVGKRGMTEEQT